MLIAFKAIALDRTLSAMEKSVAVAILDSFNRKTAQCDPSFDRIAHLLGISRRSVIRAVKTLVARRFLLRDRHGGNSHRNSYMPNWARLEEIEAAWSARKHTKHWGNSGANLSPSRRQRCHLAGDAAVTQTFISNLSKETSHPGDAKTAPPSPSPRDGSKGSAVGSVGQGRRSTTNSFPNAGNHPAIDEHAKRLVSASPSSSAGHLSNHLSHAQTAAAERRLSADLHRRFASDEAEYGNVVEAIDECVWASAVQAEVRGQGGGMIVIIAALAGLLASRDAASAPDGGVDPTAAPTASNPADNSVASTGPGTPDCGEPL